MFLRSLLRLIFYWPIRITAKCESIPLDPLRFIDKSKPICYLTVSSSIANLLTIERLTDRLGLPSPFEPLVINGKEVKRLGYIRKPHFFNSKASYADILPIFNSWFKAIEDSDHDLQIIPVTVLWSRNPSYEGQALRGVTRSTPGWRKFLTVTFSGHNNATIVSTPVNLTFLKQRLGETKYPDKQELLRRLVEQFFLKVARSIVGNPFPNRPKLIEDLLARPAVLAAIDKKHAEDGTPKEELTERARAIYEVMVADTRYPLLNFFNHLLNCLWKRFYQGQTVIGGDRVRQLVSNGYEIIYIPCHRSHMDYVLLSYVIFHEGLPIPQIASGDNLNFFPVGNLIRRCGSYFIRRKMKGDNFYIALFSEYLSILFERGYATEFFIEGGRSRTGRTLPPKSGMVAMAVESQLRGLERPIAFIPTYLGYEHVSEVKNYMQELDGQAKQKESALQLLGIFKRLRFYGRGYVSFGQPVIISRYLNENVPNWRSFIDPSGTARAPEWLRSTVNNIARQIIVNLNDAATLNGINLCALAIISDKDHMMTRRMLNDCINLYIKLLKVVGRKHLPQDDSLTLIAQALQLNKFRIYDVGDDIKVVRPSHGQTLQLTYFQNNIVHLFALPALIANIIISNGHISRDDIRTHTRSLFYFLRHELYAPATEAQLDSFIEKYINAFIEEGFCTVSHDMIYLSGDRYEIFDVLARSIRLNLIRYLVAVTALKHTRDDQLDVPAFIQKCITYARRLPTEVTDNSPEFADPILFKIMCDTFIRHKYFSVNEDKTIHIYPEKVAKLANAAEPLLGAREVRILNGNTEYDSDNFASKYKAESAAIEKQLSKLAEETGNQA
ncbi:MAG: glycerol-3-phosphate 1-O-acyltransferase PlsB [Succinivibrio sp.]|nr:glycerol-3-phosphate 1-O-acyltransferase PlsB [Succinivibrio sp.]